jgi:hypothetical protein
VNLAALRDACHFQTDYPEILRVRNAISRNLASGVIVNKKAHG